MTTSTPSEEGGIDTALEQPLPLLAGTPDVMVTPHMDRLLDCLCAQLDSTLGGPVCNCCLRPGGGLPPMDACYCDCDSGGRGQASVQLLSVFPSNRFPRNQIDQWDDACNARITWVATLQMVVYRCVSVADQDGVPPACAQLDADARMLTSDMQAMLRAFACCDWSDDRQVLPGAYTPIPPQGGCAGGMMTVLVDLGPLCCPQ